MRCGPHPFFFDFRLQASAFSGFSPSGPLAGRRHRLSRIRPSRPEPAAHPEDFLRHPAHGPGDGPGLPEQQLLEAGGHDGDRVFEIHRLALLSLFADVREEAVAMSGKEPRHGDKVEMRRGVPGGRRVRSGCGTRPPRWSVSRPCKAPRSTSARGRGRRGRRRRHGRWRAAWWRDRTRRRPCRSGPAGRRPGRTSRRGGVSRAAGACPVPVLRRRWSRRRHPP